MHFHNGKTFNIEKTLKTMGEIVFFFFFFNIQVRYFAFRFSRECS